jgi:hypothetical protein
MVGLVQAPNLSATQLQQAQTVMTELSALVATVQPAETTPNTSTVSQAPAQPTSSDEGASTDTATDTASASSPANPDNSGTAWAPQMVKVTFSTSTVGATVSIDNLDEATVRVTNLDVSSGTLQWIGFDDSSFQYSASFTDATGKTFNALSCAGLGSEGKATLPMSAPSDPCKRMDANEAVNEIQSGETMTLRYSGDPSGVTYVPGSIVEVDSGADVPF